MIQQKQVTQMEIIEALNNGATVITANKRLAGVTRQLFEKANIGNGLDAWPTPQVFPWGVWLHNTWEEAIVSGVLAEPALLLTPQQELHIWEKIIAESIDNPLLQINGTARQAQQAWQLMQEWQLELGAVDFNYNNDSVAFKKWASEFQTLALEKNWLSMSRLADALYYNADKGTLDVAKELVLFGFDELTPQQQALLSVLTASGCNVSWVQLAGMQSKVVRVAGNDSRHEADVVARWARQCVDDNPEVSIAIVVPELQSKRNVITQALDSALLPQALNPTEGVIERPYNVSLGLPLSSYSIIKTALQLLGFLPSVISLQDAGILLNSPYIRGWSQEADARALLDACLRKNVGELEISLKTLRGYATKKDKDDKDEIYVCPELVKNIDAWNNRAKKIKGEYTAAQWAEKFSALLKAFGWAGGRPLSSEEYQATEAWRDLLVSFASIDVVAETMTASVAITHLYTMAENRIYQSQTGHLPIQVLGVLEAEEIQFDYLWVMGLHDGVWPSSPNANPFLPRSLQQQKGLPHSSEDKELQVARRTTTRLLASAPEVIISYPKRDGDNELRVSSLVSNIGEVELEELKLSQAATWTELIHNAMQLEILKNDPAPVLGTERARGGSAILKYQANCPFRAFAELRLGAKALEEPVIGVSPMVRGILIHEILENVWLQLESQDHLLAIEPSDLKLMVLELANEAIEKIAWRYPQSFTERYRELESERLCLRVIDWLKLEAERPAFKVIGREQEKFVKPNDDITIRVVIDRIDEVEGGKKLVIDYKTGTVSPGQWFSDRPEDPQMPLYSMATEGDVAAVAFAQVRVGEMAFKGVAEEAGLLPKVGSFDKLRVKEMKETWDEVLEDWESTMKKLAKEYFDGVSAIDPKTKDTCEKSYCKLKSLCRIDELTAQDTMSVKMEEQS